MWKLYFEIKQRYEIFEVMEVTILGDAYIVIPVSRYLFVVITVSYFASQAGNS